MYNNLFGKWGEEVAVCYLVAHGYEILARNWRDGHKEIDIIAQKDHATYLVEVKTRNGETWNAERAVDAAKRRQMIRASYAWRLQHPSLDPIHFAVMAIVRQPHEAEPEIRFYPKAFTTVYGR